MLPLTWADRAKRAEEKAQTEILVQHLGEATLVFRQRGSPSNQEVILSVHSPGTGLSCARIVIPRRSPELGEEGY